MQECAPRGRMIPALARRTALLALAVLGASSAGGVTSYCFASAIQRSPSVCGRPLLPERLVRRLAKGPL